MTDETIPMTVSTLVDHVVVTNTVVEQLEAHRVRLHHGDGEYSGVPRYVADEIGQAVLALVPEDVTPQQGALLDAVRDVAWTADAPAAEYAGKQLVRLAAAAFDYPLPEPVQRAGGLELGLRKAPEVAPWPFKPGTAVRDEDGAEAEWLDAAPEDTVVIADDGVEWTRRVTAWFRTDGGGWMTSLDLTARGPLTVVSVPDQEANRG